MKAVAICNQEMVSPAPPEEWLAAGLPRSLKCGASITADLPNDLAPDAPVHVRCQRGHQSIITPSGFRPDERL